MATRHARSVHGRQGCLPHVKRRAPPTDAPCTQFVSPRDEKCGLVRAHYYFSVELPDREMEKPLELRHLRATRSSAIDGASLTFALFWFPNGLICH